MLPYEAAGPGLRPTMTTSETVGLFPVLLTPVYSWSAAKNSSPFLSPVPPFIVRNLDFKMREFGGTCDFFGTKGGEDRCLHVQLAAPG